VSPISHSAPSPSNKSLKSTHQQGFTILETLVAVAIFGTMLAAAFSVFSVSLQTKRSTDLQLNVQQNLRAAMQIISQDLRSAGAMHLYNQSTCTSSVPCSNNTQVAVLALTGFSTPVTTAPGSSTATTTTAVCNSGPFAIGDIAIRYNGTAISATASSNAINYGFNNARILEVTAVPTSPQTTCTTGNSETLTHASSTSETIDPNGQSYVFQSALNTYMIGTDPADSSKKALLMRSGLSTLNTGYTTPKVVAYDMDPNGLTISYGVRSNQDSTSASTLKFYNTFAEAVTAADSQSTTSRTHSATFSNTPGAATYIGGVITAVRITLKGKSASNLPGTSQADAFTLTETVDLRN
jgi:prepilin-type N-terminal cleavage/methylation domain-containing protein